MPPQIERPLRPRAVLAPLGLWLAMAVVAVINGGFREAVLIPRVGKDTGHLLSTAALVAAILVLAWLYFRTTSVQYATRELLLIGVLWTVLTVVFEFLVGYIEGTPVSVTLGQYNVFAGHVWIAVPLALLLAPVVFGQWLAGR